MGGTASCCVGSSLAARLARRGLGGGQPPQQLVQARQLYGGAPAGFAHNKHIVMA